MKKIIQSLIDHLREKGMIHFASILGSKRFLLHSDEKEMKIIGEMHRFLSSRECDLLDYSMRIILQEREGGEYHYVYVFQFFDLQN